ncbi:hypothetical protein CDAR_128361 [Caerostris darwini]|uniref:Uncharacterized protein n=1 Tax=Caerostris darwini TaxID=1538125 RepID=A0AAV4RYR0_9ARAC|nr:hypothetical protein CDAR_128361 [Caerostris darwini]
MNPSRIEWLFAHDLMNFAMKDRDLFWVPATVVTFYRITSPTVFTVDVGRAVRKFTISVKVRTKKKFKLIYESGLSTSLQFEMFMRNYALVHFTNEFSSRNFLPFVLLLRILPSDFTSMVPWKRQIMQSHLLQKF